MKNAAIFAVVLVALLTGVASRAEVFLKELSSTNTFDASKIVFKLDEATLFGTQMSGNVDDMVRRKDFDGLGQLADGFRTRKTETADGTWMLLIFYRQLSEMDNTTNEDRWVARLQFLEEWVSVRPSSITARVALARCYKAYAWNARGYETHVTLNGFRLFKERLAEARRILDQAKKLKAKCPVWWDTMQFIALGQGWDHDACDALFNEAIAYEPNYVFFYNNKVICLLPRWHGQEGDWQAFAAQSADKLGGEAGDILYARIGWRVHQRGFYDGFLRDSLYAWPRLKKGLEAIVKQRPESLGAMNELVYLSWQQRDPENARALFQHIDTNVDMQVWNGDRARFVRARQWAIPR